MQADFNKSNAPDLLCLIAYQLGSIGLVFQRTANVLSHRRSTEGVQDVGVFERKVIKKPTLQKAIIQINQAFNSLKHS